MNPQQHPIGTGFTADEVLAGLDLSSKYVIITGGHAGLGLETTRVIH